MGELAAVSGHANTSLNLNYVALPLIPDEDTAVSVSEWAGPTLPGLQTGNQ